ncbi:hypothetical protein BGZ65_011652, partial [Modicella reniformis]
MTPCMASLISATYYIDTLYMFCQGIDTVIGLDYGVVMMFRDNGTIRDTSLSTYYQTDVKQFLGSVIQPIGGTDGKHNRFAFITNAPSGYTMGSISLTTGTIGDLEIANWDLNITDSYGDKMDKVPNYTPVIIGGSVVGVLLLLAAILYLLFQRWKRKFRAKILENMSTDVVHPHGDRGDDFNKIEESSLHSVNLAGRDKILVTDDMELDGVVGLGAGYMQEVGLNQHPRPAVVTSLVDENHSNCIETVESLELHSILTASSAI